MTCIVIVTNMNICLKLSEFLFSLDRPRSIFSFVPQNNLKLDWLQCGVFVCISREVLQRRSKDRGRIGWEGGLPGFFFVSLVCVLVLVVILLLLLFLLIAS